MKRYICILLICALSAAMLSGCDRAASNTPTDEPAQEVVNFAPETTAVASVESPVEAPVESDDTLQAAADQQPATDDQPVVQDSAATAEPVQEPTPEAQSADTPAQPAGDQPLAATPQPNARINGYSEVSNTGLGFRYNYPTGWNNIPGRSTVCYVQPLEEGTVYPARVAVTMKKLAHKPKDEVIKEELVSYLKFLMSQYDEKTFEVDDALNTSGKFMGEDSMSTTYLAYDGDQEIKGYVVITAIEKYLFCYHFLCAYQDYGAFESAMHTMRDSVKAEKLTAEE